MYLEIPNGGRTAEALHSKVTSMRFLDLTSLCTPIGLNYDVDMNKDGSLPV